MHKNYSYVTPSLDGIIRHESMEYEGVKRPTELTRIFDRPNYKNKKISDIDHKLAEQYFHDLYGILMKKISHFAVDSNPGADEPLKLQAMLQEFIKIKQLLAGQNQIT